MSKYITRVQRTTPTSPWSAESTLKFKREGGEREVLVLTARTTKHHSGSFMHHTVTAYHVVDAEGGYETHRHAAGKDLAQSVALGGDVPKRLTRKAVERIHLAAMERLPEEAALKAVRAFYKDVYPDLTLA